jgi:hypothetical protein
MKKISFVCNFVFVVLLIGSCADSKQEKEKTTAQTAAKKEKILAKITQETFDIRNDSTIFNSATIENFDVDGNSIDVFWLDAKRDTILRFYRTYDANKKLIGATYYEAGDTEPSRDTVYINPEGKKVEASLNAEGNISWKSTITTDANGNPVLKTYENGKGAYRGFDSLYFDERNREIKGFYENSKGKRFNVRTYTYITADKQGNWLKRVTYKNDTIVQKQARTLEYHQ